MAQKLSTKPQKLSKKYNWEELKFYGALFLFSVSIIIAMLLIVYRVKELFLNGN